MIPPGFAIVLLEAKLHYYNGFPFMLSRAWTVFQEGWWGITFFAFGVNEKVSRAVCGVVTEHLPRSL
jgi:hypothetical protein